MHDAANHRTASLILRGDAPSTTASVAVHAFAAGCGFSPERATAVQLVVEELLRAARERETTDEDRTVELDFAFDGQALRIAVADRGLPLDGGEARHAPVRRLHHLGFCSRLHLGFSGASGNLALVEVDLAGRELVHHDHFEGEEDGADPVVDDLEVRRMTPDDAPALIRCLYRCYGYTYPLSQMYDARHVRHALETGSMHSVVAVTPSGEVVGHAALVFAAPGDRAAEAGRLIVDPRYRGHQLAERMGVLRRHDAAALGIAGTYAKAVTNHTASQKNQLKLGGREVGCILGMAPSSLQMEGGLSGPAAGRRSQVVYYTNVSLTPDATVSAPAHLAQFVTSAAERLGVSRVVDGGLVTPTTRHTHLRTEADGASGFAEIRLLALGADLATRVLHELASLSAMHVEFTALDVDASDPSAAWAITELERLGFAYAAWLPDHTASGDTIVLQRVAPSLVDFDDVHCARSEGEVLRDALIAELRRVAIA